MTTTLFLKRTSILLITFLLCAVTLSAQHANFELAEKFKSDGLRQLVGSLTVEPNWFEDSEAFWYSYKTGDGTHYWLVDPARRSKTPLFDRDRLAGELTKTGTGTFDARDLPLEDIEFDKAATKFTFKIDSLKYEFVIETGVLTSLGVAEEEENNRWAVFSPDSTMIAFAKGHNLFLMRADDPDSNEIQLTTDGERWYSFAADDNDTTMDERVRPNASWFPDSKKLYVRRSDERKVGDLWLVHALSEPRPTLEHYKYEMPGEDNIAQNELLIFDVAAKSRVRVDADKWHDQSIGGGYFSYKRGIMTGEGSDKIWFMRRNREWNKVDLCVADTETGEVKVLLTEESKPYFNTRYAQLHIVGDDLIWWSERDGWGHYYRYDHDGNLKNRITCGSWIAGDVVSIDTTAQTIYFTGNGREEGIDPYYNLYYKVRFDGSGFSKITSENATHSFDMSESNRFFVDTYSRVDLPSKTVLRDNSGNVVLELESVDTERLYAYGWKPPVPFSVKAADGITDLYGVMWKPFNMDPEKKYPVVVLCYPGPQAEPVPKTFFQIRNQRVNNTPLAQLGFVVLAVGQRGGSPQRSKYYHNFGYGNARDYPLADNKAAIENLADKYPFMDISRVGIYGRSGGGFMSTAAILKYPDFYKAAFSSCGNHDNNIYNIYWGEVHYGVEEVIEMIEESGEEKIEWKTNIDTNPAIASNLKGNLFLIHGEVDNNVHPANTIRLADALIQAGKRFDFMLFPGKRHAYGDYTKYIERLMWHFFAEHLMGDYRTNIDIYEVKKSHH